MSDGWRWILAAIATLITLTACDAAPMQADQDYCRGALSVAATRADTVHVIERDDGIAHRGEYCAQVIGRTLRLKEASPHAR